MIAHSGIFGRCVSDESNLLRSYEQTSSKTKRWGIYVKQAKNVSSGSRSSWCSFLCEIGQGSQPEFVRHVVRAGGHREQSGYGRDMALCVLGRNGWRLADLMSSLPPSADRAATAVHGSEAAKGRTVVFEGRRWCGDRGHMFCSARRSIRGFQTVRIGHRCRRLLFSSQPRGIGTVMVCTRRHSLRRSRLMPFCCLAVCGGMLLCLGFAAARHVRFDTFLPSHAR